MPPRRSARVAAVVERQTSALAPLPHAIVLAIFALLPVDQRLRCLEVCRGWRAALSDASLWLRLDLRRASGLACVATDGLLRAAAARAGGLHALDVSGMEHITLEALLAVVRANAGTLQELSSVCQEPDARFFPLATAEDLLRAAPLLRAFTADVTCGSVEAARRLLQNEGLLRPMRVHHLEVSAINADEAEVLALAAYVAACETLTRLVLDSVPLRTAAALDAVVAAALARRLSSVHLWFCHLTVAAVPALARLLGGGALRTLSLCCGDDDALLDAPTAPLLSAALRASATLESLTLTEVRLWHDGAAATAVLAALTAHPSLRTLDVSRNGPVGAAVAAALGALVAANAPALAELDVSGDDVAQEGLAPLLDALLRNTHLRVLACEYNRAGATAAFVRQRLLPAVRANSSLRTLKACPDDEAAQSEALALLRQAEALVAARNAAR
jgi:hypothetical protein